MNPSTFTQTTLVFLLALLLMPGSVFSQMNFSESLQAQPVGPDGLRRCASVEVDALRRMQNTDLPTIQEFEQWLAPRVADYQAAQAKISGLEKGAVLQIPVVVHVLHNGEPIGTAPNITDAQVLSQIQVLNEDFRKVFGTRGYNENPVGADLEIEFVMARSAPDGSATNGIVRRNVGQDGVTTDDLENTIKPATIWEATQYMNMWSVKFTAPDDNILGYAQFPEGSGQEGLPESGEEASTDGVVMRYQSFGTSDLDDGSFILDAPYDLGRTATHEVGHWIGLRHIWGDGLGCNLSAPVPGCSCSEDDFCDDTPNSDNANYGCPEDKTSSCEDPLEATSDMVENYMDYSDDACMNIFTEDQKARAQAVMTHSPRRRELPTSPGLLPPASYVAFANTQSSVLEGNSCDLRQVAIALEISQLPTATVEVTLGVIGGTADENDFQLATEAIIFSPSTSTSANVLVDIYEDTAIEILETLTIEIIDVNGPGLPANAGLVHTLAIVNDDYARELAGFQPGVTFFNEGFGGGLSNWTQQGGASETVRWTTGSPVLGMAGSAYISRTDLPGQQYVYDGTTGANRALISPAIDLTNAANLELSFDYIALGEEDATSGERFDYGLVQVSFDNGTTWTTASEPLVNTPMAEEMTIDLPPAANGCSDFRIAFRWINDELLSLDPPLSIDNVRLEGSMRAPVRVLDQVNTNQIAENSFGPNATLEVYDPVSGRLIMHLENNSDFDFGCTSIEVDRSRNSAGANSVAFWNNAPSQALAAKTFRVETENIPSTEESVTARLYFTQAEILAWEFDTGRSRTELQMVTVAEHPISSVNATNSGNFTIQLPVTQVGTYNTSNITVEAEVNSLSDLGIGAGVPGNSLPVNLTVFSADLQADGAAALNWTTEREIDNDYFKIEHSNDGRYFTIIGEKPGKGNAETLSNYSFLHRTPPSGMNYYRLVQYDFSGASTVSPITILEVETTQNQLEAYPNPVRATLHIKPFHSSSEVEIKLLDARGGIVRSSVLAPMTNEKLDLSALEAGTYFLNWKSAEAVGTQTIVVVP